jgi:hypothetical protein
VAKKQQEAVYRLRVVLRDITPACWRDLEVPGSMKLRDLHCVLQAVMPWSESHLHEFRTWDLSDHSLTDEEELKQRCWSDPRFELEHRQDDARARQPAAGSSMAIAATHGTCSPAI